MGGPINPIAPYSLSNNLDFSIDEYNYTRVSKVGQQMNIDVGNNSNSLFSINFFNGSGQSGTQQRGRCASIEQDVTSTDDLGIT